MAQVLQQQNVQAGDFVAVFMTNSPEMVFTIYAITKLGAAPALINASLRSEKASAKLRSPTGLLTTM